MRKLNLNLAFVLLLTAGGCSQIIGLGDYEIDPNLDGVAAKAGTRNGGEGGEGGDHSHSGGHSGAATAGKSGGGGTSPAAQGGQGGEVVDPGLGGQAGNPSVVGGAGGEGGAKPVTREVIPSDSLASCLDQNGIPEGVELLLASNLPQTPYYGDFELGTTADGNSPWLESTTSGEPVVSDETSADAHKGDYFAWLGGFAEETSFLTSEAFEIPSDAGWIVLSGYREFQIDSDDADAANTDYAYIELSNEQEYLHEFFYWDETDPGQTADWVKFEASVDAAPHQGATRYLDFVTETDAYFTDDQIEGSNYMFDDVSLQVFRCYKP